ncbi:MAG: diacylglycerol kinase family protein [Caldilineaceae bacterium]
MPEFMPLPAKLIYNTKAGAAAKGPAARLDEVAQHLRSVNIIADTAQVTQADEVTTAAAVAVRDGYSLIIACGGDGTIESAANALIAEQATLGILPFGTRNNVARSLGIPLKLANAARLLRTGTTQKIGAGLVTVGERQRWFLETFSVGLFSALYPHADAIQKGDLVRARDLLLTFVTSSAARMHLTVDGTTTLTVKALALIGVNMPSTGANFRLGAGIAYDDEHIDLFLYDRLDQLDFLVYGLDILAGMPEDPAIQRIRARHVSIQTLPLLPVMADGFEMGAGPVDVSMVAHCLNVIAGNAPPKGV